MSGGGRSLDHPGSNHLQSVGNRLAIAMSSGTSGSRWTVLVLFAQGLVHIRSQEAAPAVAAQPADETRQEKRSSCTARGFRGPPRGPA